jgi:hypothetical protein
MTKCESETADDSGTQFSAIASRLFEAEALSDANRACSKDDNFLSQCYGEPRIKPPETA